MKKVFVALLAVVVMSSPGWIVATGSAAQAEPATTQKRAAGAAAAAAFSITPGVTFNNPRRGNQAQRVIGKIRRSINNVPRGARISVMTWNFNHRGIAGDLVKAHKRGVGVRVIMARELVSPVFRNLGRSLGAGNRGRPGHMKSFTRTCSKTCRGYGGAMHSKLMLITKAGSSSNIVQHGSANFTYTAASSQWTDWYALPNNRAVYKAWENMFEQALRDRAAKPLSHTKGHVYSWFAPRAGRPDNVLNLLNDVRCTGARGAGINGRTAIRVASAVFQNDRGNKIARKLKSLKNQGCNVRVVFTMMTNTIRNTIRGVPTRQLVYDWDGDGSFDRYLHMKSMTISGNFRGDRGHSLIFNGSANWSTMGVVSDEQGMVIHDSDFRTKQYASWIDSLYNSAPRGLRPTPEEYIKQGKKNPYEGLELELEGQTSVTG